MSWYQRVHLATDRAMSTVEISDECKLPSSTTYRRISSMIDSGLITVEKSIITESGKRYDLFRSVVRSVEVRYDIHEEVTISLTPNIDIISKFVRIWKYMKKGIEIN